MGSKMIELNNKFFICLMAVLFFFFGIYILIEGHFSYKGVEISGIRAYIIGIIDFVIGITFVSMCRSRASDDS